MNERVRIEPPQGALLPAEERLQNVLKAIEDRMKEVRAELAEMEDNGWYEGYREVREFLSGLDIAWSLAQTEILRRGRCASQFTRGGLLPGLNECELENGHDSLHEATIAGTFLWSDEDAD